MRAWSFQGERSNGLKFASVVELEVFFFEVGNDFAMRVAYDDADQDVVDANFEGCRGILGGNFLGVARRSRTGRLGSRVGT